MPENPPPLKISPRKELLESYRAIRPVIENRLKQFRQVWKKASEEDIFAELVFCLLTPQAKAQPCWRTVEKLRENDLLFKGGEKQLSRELCCARFRFTKAKSIVLARKMFTIRGKVTITSALETFTDAFETREWLATSVNGMGYKEASHFLRNVGLGEDLGILDRHILRNLVDLEVIPEIPRSITQKKYLEIEKKMREFSEDIAIPMAKLDLLLWYKETGEVFK